MRVVIIGGAGRYGRATTYFLANDPLVSELVIADKNVDVARAFAERLGDGVQTAEVDLRDEQSLDALLAGADIFVNTAGPYFETQIPALRAAIRCGVNYCDFSEDFQATEQALALDPEAKAANITAIIGIGLAPGITNLMAVHAVDQIDITEKLQVGWASDNGPGPVAIGYERGLGGRHAELAQRRGGIAAGAAGGEEQQRDRGPTRSGARRQRLRLDPLRLGVVGRPQMGRRRHALGGDLDLEAPSLDESLVDALWMTDVAHADGMAERVAV